MKAQGFALFLFLTVFLLMACERAETPETAAVPAVGLSDQCPPGFELMPDGTCQLRSLYQLYSSQFDVGVGGLKTGLPPVRDGFTPQQIDLGRLLFFDPVLSANGQLSCATCHNPAKGFADGLPRSKGIKGTEVQRSAPSLWNVAFLHSFFWDGRAKSLEEQMRGPLFSDDEMGNTEAQLLASLNGLDAYIGLFKQAFPKHKGPIDMAMVATAIGAFEASLISLNSRYDQYAHGYHQALSPDEIEGLNVFRSFVARCSECHTPPLFTNQQLAVLGTPEPDGRALDPGAGAVLNDPTLRAAFKVPSLRNVVLTAPYMHSGRFSNLTETIQFYSGGRGRAVPAGENLKIHWHIWEPKLSAREVELLITFLGTLTDQQFMPKVPTEVPSGKKIEMTTYTSTDQ